jgi:hypothetical protein
MRLTRTDWKYLVDTLLVLSFLGLLVIGVLLAFVIPEGPLDPGGSKFFLGLHRHQWGDVHAYLSLTFAALVLVHILLAWTWVRGKSAALFGKGWRAILGVTVLAALAVPAVFWLVLPKNDPAYAEYGHGEGRRALLVDERGSGRGEPDSPAPPAAVMPAEPQGTRDQTVSGQAEAGTAEIVITGRMTFREIERVTGIPAADIASGLGLPSGVSFDETVGRLRRVHGFEMSALRDVVAGLLEKRPPSALD